ncbi:hypothetical protein CN514_06710 [Bacillus sp. AFS001701]|uniref:hypothetical protein n=1 Tax=Bacillaceae TaxID=186817 RepID=UPI000BF44D83|nr:hypothetical protein [Bacillus sp. AFS001701]PET71491.1 hypothetical protein CN514_06710 [Bacillus sp. AFS001701]
MSCNCNNGRNNDRNNDRFNDRNNDRNDDRNDDRNNRRNREVTFNARITVDQEDFCRAVDRCDDERRDNSGRRSDRWWNF